MILLIDNYDSFTYNLYQYLCELNQQVEVYRNDKITISDIEKINPDYIVISPGPGRPENAGICIDLIKKFYTKKPILGVCLGHQAIGYAFGAKIVNANKIVHGKTSNIFHKAKSIFKNISNPFKATRYHSLIIERESLPDEFEIIAETEDNIIMAIMHKKYNNLIGVQFHPESILTDEGKKILFNFLYSKQQETQQSDFKVFLNKVVEMKNLEPAEANSAMEIIMSGAATPAQIASFLTALRLKGETEVEIAEFAKVMHSKATRIKINREPVIDTYGTGGDRSHTFNISTISAFVIAAAGGIVAKHGNRSVSSKCGSADLLLGLGVDIDIPPERIEQIINKIGIGFLFAPKLHSAMKYAIGPRREMAIRTVFNLLGPLTNPANAKYQLLGIYDLNLTEKIGAVLKLLKTKHSVVVAGLDGLDEITLTGPTKITEIKDEEIFSYYFKPDRYGFELCEPADLKGGDIMENVAIAKLILQGKDKSPKTNAIIINAGFGLYISKISSDLKSAFELAKEIIYSKKAYQKLEELIEETKKK